MPRRMLLQARRAPTISWMAIITSMNSSRFICVCWLGVFDDMLLFCLSYLLVYCITYVYIYIYIYIPIHIHMYIYIYIYIYNTLYAHICTNTYVYIYIHVYVCAHMCVYIYIYIYTHKHLYIYIYTHNYVTVHYLQLVSLLLNSACLIWFGAQSGTAEPNDNGRL